jgi:hypothetical protein
MRSRDVDPVKCPVLHAKLVRQEERASAEWQRVSELKRAGKDGSAKRLVKKLLGVKKGPPMPEEVKEELARHKEEHAVEIKERKDQEREIHRRTIALLTTGKTDRRKS